MRSPLQCAFPSPTYIRCFAVSLLPVECPTVEKVAPGSGLCVHLSCSFRSKCDPPVGNVRAEERQRWYGEHDDVSNVLVKLVNTTAGCLCCRNASAALHTKGQLVVFKAALADSLPDYLAGDEEKKEDQDRHGEGKNLTAAR